MCEFVFMNGGENYICSFLIGAHKVLLSALTSDLKNFSTSNNLSKEL